MRAASSESNPTQVPWDWVGRSVSLKLLAAKMTRQCDTPDVTNAYGEAVHEVSPVDLLEAWGRRISLVALEPLVWMTAAGPAP